MPLQHGDRRVLKRMMRPHNMDKQAAFFQSLRAALPEVSLRTTFIVGFPGETEAEFQGLLDFMTEIQFDKVGVFQFSPEPGTPAGAMAHQVPDEVKQARWARAMAHQQSIALARQETVVGQLLEVLVDGYDAEQGIALCRSYREAPEVDGYVLVPGEHEAGDRLRVRVTAALPYDLEARLIRRFPRLERPSLTEAEIVAEVAPPLPGIALSDIAIR